MQGVVTILTDATGSATGNTYTPSYATRGFAVQPVIKFQAYETGTGAVTGTVLIEGSNDPSYASWVTIATLTLSGTTAISAGTATTSNWPNVRARTTAISGTSASIVVTMGI